MNSSSVAEAFSVRPIPHCSRAKQLFECLLGCLGMRLLERTFWLPGFPPDVPLPFGLLLLLKHEWLSQSFLTPSICSPFMVSPAILLNVILKVVEVEVWVAVFQLPLTPQRLQLWKCHMPRSISKPGAGAIISQALTSVMLREGSHLATTVTELHLSHWPGCLRPARSHQTGCLSPVRICQAGYLRMAKFFKISSEQTLKAECLSQNVMIMTSVALHGIYATHQNKLLNIYPS